MGTGRITNGGGHLAANVAALWLIAVALLVRLAVPVGWMPAGDGSGIIPCPAAGAVPMPHGDGMAASAHAMHHHGKHVPDGGADHPCAFSGFAAALLAPALSGADPAPAAVPPVVVLPLSAAVAIGRGLAAPPPPPTGPPAAL